MTAPDPATSAQPARPAPPTQRRQRVAVFGATGSIGRSALDVISRHPDRYEVSVLASGRQVAALLDACRVHRPRHAVIADSDCYTALRDGLAALGLPTRPHAGPAALDALAAARDHEDGSEIVVAAIVGAAGLDSTLAAVHAGKRVLLANKESLVLAGELLMAAARRSGACVIPVDSEHNAIFQCLPDAHARPGLDRILLTASGGPFRRRSRAELAGVTPDQALAHPKWRMGPKISIDSATLMNKGLEVIEAHHLFDLPGDRIEVLVHPQSLVHSLVAFADGSQLAQLGLPDMRTAIAVGLAWPERIASGVERLDLLAHGRLDFEPPDRATFACLDLAYAALAAGGTAPAILNAANEVAVSAFLQRRIAFLTIPALVAATLDALPPSPADSLDTLREADARARALAEAACTRHPVSA